MRHGLRVLLALLPVCALGRGIGGSTQLRSQQIAYPSPAELEEQEETEGTQEQHVATIPREQQESAEPSLPSLVADGVAGSSLPQGSVTTLQVMKLVPSASFGDAESANAPFPTLLPVVGAGPNSSALTGGTAFQADPPPGFEATSNSYSSCNPPCATGRGICNNKVCWCKTPYTGSTCQHKVGELQRVAVVFVAAFSLICIILGVIFAQGVHAVIGRYLEKKMARLGKGILKNEVWESPEGGKGKARGHAEGAHDHEIVED